jgi:YgiT-type zinc finger domain-containing protein
VERPTFTDSCPLCDVGAVVAEAVRHVSITYLDGMEEAFPAAVIMQCRACGAFFVGSSLMQQLRLIPRGVES